MRALLASLACGWSCACVAAPQATIELRAEAAVAGDTVTLGDVAILRSADLALIRRLVQLPIGPAPRADRPGQVSREALAHWIEARMHPGEQQLEWRGADAARVLRVTRRATGVEIAAAAAEALTSWLAAQGLAAQVQQRQLPRDVELPAGQARLQVRPLGEMPARGRMLVWVDVWCAEAFVRSVAVPLDVRFDEQPGAAQRAFAMAAPPLAASALAPAPAAPPLVARGEWATLRSTAGVVTLESRVEVLQDGRAGQRVRVRPAGATGIVFARVLGPAQLELAP